MTNTLKVKVSKLDVLSLEVLLDVPSEEEGKTMIQINFRLGTKYVEKIDELVEDKLFLSRSECLRFLVRYSIKHLGRFFNYLNEEIGD